MSAEGPVGHTDERFAPLHELFAAILAADPSYSAQVAVRWRGEEVVNLAGGPHLVGDSLSGVFSVSKGMTALAVASLLDEGVLDLDEPVARYWPEFAAAGKGSLSVRLLLSHQAGLPVFREVLPLAEILDLSAAGADRLAGQTPVWRPGSAFGYHALTIGVLVEELVRRVTGESLQRLYAARIRAPRDADAFLGLPASEDHRYVPVLDPVLTPRQRAEQDALPPKDGLAELVFANLDAPEDGSPSGTTTNNPSIRRHGPAAVGGVASAAGLARLYADALPGAARPIASPAVFEAMSQQQAWGTDRVLGVENCFGVLFLLPQPRMPFGGLGAFGHDGAGGALSFADPSTGLSFGYVPCPRQHPGGADSRSLVLAALARRCVLGGARPGPA
ncbi:serine hydrolase domain-containing protein [Cellulomonas hominis]